MSIKQTIKRPFVWLRRFRKRCGYGVHSPFAFDFITNVIYEKADYYAYSELEAKSGAGKIYREKEINRLLFRIVNWLQPKLIVDAGPKTTAADFMKAAKESASYISVKEHDFGVPLNKFTIVDFLYLHHYERAVHAERHFDNCIRHVAKNSVFVIHGIHYSSEMKKAWKEMVDNVRSCVTFDLYDVGIIFFDYTKVKQHYIVNF